MSSDQERLELFLSIGCNPKLVKGFVKNKKKSRVLENAIKEANFQNGCEPHVGALLLHFATTVDMESLGIPLETRKLILSYFTDEKLKNLQQVDAAIRFVKAMPDGEFNSADFDQSCGVGFEVSQEDIEQIVRSEISRHSAVLLEQKYDFNVFKLLGEIKKQIPFADGQALKSAFDAQLVALIGERPQKSKKTKNKKPAEAKKTPAKENQVFEEEDPVEALLKKYSGRDMKTAHNSPELIAEHNRITGGKVRCRFPPEPNGFLHVGHAKAMSFSFGVAEATKGVCYLRFDDTNPSAEEVEYIDSIIENVKWLGHTPWKITYSSDYFEELYEMAVELIRREKAYVCFQTQEEIKKTRVKKNHQEPSPWRYTSVEENLARFSDMRHGLYAEGEAVLRMKIDITSMNPCMWDPVAYRIKYEPHPHAGSGWCIYPSYDFTHCLVDSIEHITNSLCTLEFEIRRDSYYWLLDALDIYRPMVWEYSRLNITYNVLSKRKLKHMVLNGLVSGWDDPRLLTINGLRRRGFTSAALNDMCQRVGVSRTTTGFVKYSLLEACARLDLDKTAPRTMGVLDPVKVVIENWEGGEEKIRVDNFPADSSKGSHVITLNSVLYIDRADFRTTDEKVWAAVFSF